MSVGRNDPCPCGSGKKYKRCCMARDKAEQADRVGWEHAARDMRIALVGYAKESVFVKDLATGLGLFWQDRYTAETIHLMNVDESLRFFDWFAHDYRMQHIEEGAAEQGKRLIEIYRQQVSDALTDKESAMLDGWIDSPPGSAFVLQEADAEQGTVLLEDLFMPERTLTVKDTAAASHGEVGQILLARPLPERDHLRLSGATVLLPADQEQALKAYVEGAYQAYMGIAPEDLEEPREGADLPDRDADRWGAFLRDRAYLFTHYALNWAEEQGRPAISAQDPKARKPGGQAVRKLIKWSHERTRSW